HIGRTADGRQFFLTTPFIPDQPDGSPGCEFIVLYLFDEQGKLLHAQIDNLGSRAQLDRKAAKKLYKQRLAELGSIRNERIEIQPFQFERFGTVFGFVLREPEGKGSDWAVDVQPGDYMAFFRPFDSGM